MKRKARKQEGDCKSSKDIELEQASKLIFPFEGLIMGYHVSGQADKETGSGGFHSIVITRARWLVTRRFGPCSAKALPVELGYSQRHGADNVIGLRGGEVALI
jgi:hypothetical protein